MSTIRRLYLYVVAFISLLVITWGLIGLARSAFAGDEIGGNVARLAGALALIFVGIPVFLLHWWWAQRSAYQDVEERSSYIRAFFLYGALLATLIPIVQNILTWLNRAFHTLFDLSREATMFGSDQIWSDNLIAVVMNGLIAAYVFSVLRKDWAAGPEGNAFAETRRLYRYVWVLYGLGLTVSGVQQITLFVFDSLEESAIASQSILANGITLLLLGIPLWIYSWRVVQNTLIEPAERESLLRAIVIFAVNLISMVSTLFAGGVVLALIFRILFGERFDFAVLIGELRDPISVALAFGITWAYFSNIRRKDFAAIEPIPQHLASAQRVYIYLSAFLGLTALYIGLQQIAFFIINLVVEQPIWTDSIREQLSAAITILVISLPFWYLNWSKANQGAARDEDEEDLARRSLARRVYLYLVLFISVIGIMITAGTLLFQILQALLGDPDENLTQAALELASLLILFTIALAYHGQVLRSDERIWSQTQEKYHAEFPILVLVSEIGEFSEMVVAALLKEAPAMPVAVLVVAQGPPDEDLSNARAVILPASIATESGEAIRLWLKNFSGSRFVLPDSVQGWMWVTGDGGSLNKLAQETAVMVRKLAEGQEITKRQSSSPWAVFGYIMGGLFGLLLLVIAGSTLLEMLY